MALVPGYKFDILISYAHRDNKPLISGHNGWVVELHLALEQRFDELFGKQLKIWRDPYLDGTHVLEKELADRVASSAILLSILSPNYLQSEWCLKERKAFCLSSERRGGLLVGNRSRLVKVVKTHLSRELHPAEMQDSIGFEFCRVEPSSKRQVDFRPETSPAEFIQMVESLAYGIQELIVHFQPTPETEPSPPQKTIYLAETSPDLEDERDRIKSELKQHGYCILPPDEGLPPKATAPELEEKVRGYLARSRMSVNMIGAFYGTIPAMAKGRSLVRMQHELALERSSDPEFGHLVWMPPGLTPQEEEQEKFVELLRTGSAAQHRIDLLDSNTRLEDLKTEIHNRLNPPKRASDSQSPGSESSESKLIYLVCDKLDYDEVHRIEDCLYNQGFEVRLPLFGADDSQFIQFHQDSLQLCDAVLAYCGNANEIWLQLKRQELIEKIRVQERERQKPMLAKGVSISARHQPAARKDSRLTKASSSRTTAHSTLTH
jgi:TIR domain